jgi:hypothetical protein
LLNKNIITVIKPRTINIITLTKMDAMAAMAAMDAMDAAATATATTELVALFNEEFNKECGELNCRGKLDAPFARDALQFPEISYQFMSYKRALKIHRKATNDYLSLAFGGMKKDELAQFKKDYESAMHAEKNTYHTEVKKVVATLVKIIKVLLAEKKAMEKACIFVNDDNRFAIYARLREEYIPTLYAFLPLLQQMNLVPHHFRSCFR